MVVEHVCVEALHRSSVGFIGDFGSSRLQANANGVASLPQLSIAVAERALAASGMHRGLPQNFR